MMDYYLIGSRIKEMRLKRGLTQEALAEMADISSNFLACIEIGKRRGSFETYAKLVEILDTSFDFLTQDSLSSAKKSVLDCEMESWFNKCTESQKRLIIKIAQDIYRHE